MAKKYDIVATIGKYEKDGETKYINRNVGAVLETQHGLSIVLDASFNPAGCPITEDGKVWLKLFEPRDDNQKAATQQRQTSQAQAEAGMLDDDIPFSNPYKGMEFMV